MNGFMYKVKRTILLAVAGFYGAAGYAQDSSRPESGQTYNLQQCVAIAIRNNATVKTSQFTMEGDKATYQQAVGNMLPFASASITPYESYNGRSINPYTYSYVSQGQTTAAYSVSASLVLWNGSSLQRFLRQTHEAYKAGEMDLQYTKDLAAIQVILDYLSVLSDQELLNLAKAQADATREQVRVDSEKNQAGSIAPGDYYTLKGQLGANDVAVTTAKNVLENAKLTLSKDMNIEYSSSMALIPVADTVILAPYGSNVEDIYSYALHNLPVVKSADLKEQSALNGIKGARGSLFPTLYLTGGATTNYSNLATTEQYLNTSQVNTGQYVTIGGAQVPVFAPEDNYASKNLGYGNQITNNIAYYIGIGVNIPILNGLSARTRLRQAKINEEQTTFNKTTTRIQLRQAVETDYVNMIAAFDTYKTLRQEVDDYTQSFNAASAKLDAGTISAFDFVIAKNNLDGANLNLISAKYNYILQTKILDYYLGRLTF
jgi:outer membrane protein